MPWHAQYSFGGDTLYLWSAKGIAKEVTQLTTKSFNPVAATLYDTLYLWPSMEVGESRVELKLPEGASVVLRPERQPYVLCFECHSGEIALKLRTLQPKTEVGEANNQQHSQ